MTPEEHVPRPSRKPFSAMEIEAWKRGAAEHRVFNWDVIQRALATIAARDERIEKLRQALEAWVGIYEWHPDGLAAPLIVESRALLSDTLP